MAVSNGQRAAAATRAHAQDRSDQGTVIEAISRRPKRNKHAPVVVEDKVDAVSLKARLEDVRGNERRLVKGGRPAANVVEAEKKVCGVCTLQRESKRKASQHM